MSAMADVRLSLAAKGVAGYIAAADRAGVTYEEVVTHCREPHGKVRDAFAELMAAGYVVPRNGKFILLDDPTPSGYMFIPGYLIHDPRYQNTSAGAKMLYAAMLEKLLTTECSVDRKKGPYITYSADEIEEYFGWPRPKCIDYFGELITAKLIDTQSAFPDGVSKIFLIRGTW